MKTWSDLLDNTRTASPEQGTDNVVISGEYSPEIKRRAADLSQRCSRLGRQIEGLLRKVERQR